MESSQSARQEEEEEGADELDEKMRKIEMKPPSTPAVGILAKNTVILPSGIARVKQLRQTSQLPLPSSSSSSSSSVLSGSATGNPRNKTALAPGHSLMDWIRLGSSGVDLTGVGGKLLTVTPAELARHNSRDDAWIAIRGVVFNVSRYMSFHPGGVPELMKGVGKDATKLFDDVHAWVNYQSILQKCVVGRLERSVNADLIFEIDKSKRKAKTVPDLAPPSSPTSDSNSLRMDWRQTTSSVSFFYSGPCGECQVRKLSNDTEHSVRICLDDEKLAVTHCLSLAEEVEWPPNCKRHAETSEIEISFKKKNREIWKTYGTFKKSSEKLKLASATRTYNEYQVLENTQLGKVVHLLVLRAQNYIQLVPPGRHVEATMDVMGTEVSRPYTPVPSCLHPDDRPVSCTEADDSSCLYLMVKRYNDGAMTPRLVQFTAGQTLRLSNSLGDFKIEAYDRYPVVNMLAAGSGLTVMLPIIKRALSRRNPPEIKLMNFNRNEDQIFYAKQLERVAGDCTLRLTHVLSDEAEDKEMMSSANSHRIVAKVSAELLKELMGERSPRGCVFSCGPPGFMEAARDALRELGWVPSQIHEFDG